MDDVMGDVKMLFIGLTAGMIVAYVCMYMSAYSTWQIGYQVRELKQKCEETIPRNRDCVIKAVPKEDER